MIATTSQIRALNVCSGIIGDYVIAPFFFCLKKRFLH